MWDNNIALVKEKEYKEPLSSLLREITLFATNALETVNFNGGGFPAPKPKGGDTITADQG